jgi:hypothetical protein
MDEGSNDLENETSNDEELLGGERNFKDDDKDNHSMHSEGNHNDNTDDVDNSAIDVNDTDDEGHSDNEESIDEDEGDSINSKDSDNDTSDDENNDDSSSRNEMNESSESRKQSVTDMIDVGSSESSNKLCTRQQIIDGKWVKDVLSKPPYVVSTVHLRCYPRETYFDKKNGWSTWKWQPQGKDDGQCTFESHFNKNDFCSLLPSGIVSIIGDSLSWEHYRSLVQLNGIGTHQGYQHQSKELYTNIYQSVCGQQTKILYRRDDKLQNVTGSILQDFPTVLVMNRGAHWVPDDELISDTRKNIAELKEHWIPKCIENKMKCHFFWRTAVPGHPFCYNKTKEKDKHGDPIFAPTYKEPINDLAFWENLIGNLSIYNNRSINFHWYDYQSQNNLVLSEFDKAFGTLNATSSYFTYEVIDAYYLNIRRPDEHRAHQVSI